MKLFGSLFCVLLLVIPFACTRDSVSKMNIDCDSSSVDDTRYSTNIMTIINASCANVGCHDGSNSSGQVEDYRTYEGILPELQNGEVFREVFELFTMPEPGSQGSNNFSEEDSELLRCWIDSGFPK